MSDNKNDNKNEQQFSIQPHPATDNDPNSLTGNNSGLLGSQGSHVASQPGPHIMGKEVASNLEEPASREELRARAEELNKQ